MRGVAAIVICQRHWALEFFGNNYFPGGYLAVDLFFLLSGFVLAHAYEAKLSDGFFRGFVIARLIRLYPSYLIGLAMAFIAIGAIPSRSMVVSALLFWPSPAGWVIGPAWTLTLELGANILYAAAFRYLTNRALLTIIVGGFVLLIALAVARGSLDQGWADGDLLAGVPRVMFAFPLGVLLWRWRFALPSTPEWLTWPAMVATSLALLSPLARVIGVPLSDLFTVALLFPILVIVCSQTRPAGRSAALAAALGASSYTLYVIHAPTLRWLTQLHLSAAQSPYLVGWGMLLGIVLLSLLIDRFYDEPFRQFLKRLGLQPAAPVTRKSR